MHIGLFFGSFNPVHIGHLAIAGYMAEFTTLDQVWMIISPHNPLKKKDSLLKDIHRLAMLRTALEDIPYLNVNDIEFHLPQPSYTVNTLVHLEEKYPQHTFSLIMGSDNLESFMKWKNAEVILERHTLFIYPRKGYEGGELKQHPSVSWVDGCPEIEISSTFIRNAVKSKKDIRYLMPVEAWNYMREMHFYE